MRALIVWLTAVALVLALNMATGGQAVAAPTVYICDLDHTEIVFRYNHGGFAPQTGEFRDFTCDLVLDADDLAASSLKVTIKAASIATGVAALDGLLKGQDYFDVAKFPDITFVSTAIKRKGRKGATVAGNLTIKGTTVPISLKVKMTKKGEHAAGQSLAAFKGDWIGFTADSKLKRSEFKLDQLLSIVADKVSLTIATEMKAR